MREYRRRHRNIEILPEDREYSLSVKTCNDGGVDEVDNMNSVMGHNNGKVLREMGRRSRKEDLLH